jgi:predicted negative regulator of RcsB-dependent stress response
MTYVRWKIAALVLLGLLLPVSALIAWQMWRDHRVRSFCQAVHAGLPIADLLGLEKRYGIDGSYLMGDFNQQPHYRELVFRSHLFDPDFECSIRHNGEVIISAEIDP